MNRFPFSTVRPLSRLGAQLPRGKSHMILSDPNRNNALIARVELIASVLSIPDGDVTEATHGDRGLIEFAGRYGQSLDWIVMGDIRGMIARLANQGAGQ